MSIHDFTTSRMIRIKFAAIYGLTVIMMAAMAFMYLRSTNSLAEKSAASVEDGGAPVLAANAMLHSRMNNLQQLYQRYVLMSSDTIEHNYDSLNLVILRSEMSLAKCLDSLDKLAVTLDFENRSGLNVLMKSFKSMLNNSKMMHALQSQMTEGVDSAGIDEQSILAMQQQLIEKDLRIADLELQLQQRPNSYAQYSVATIKATEENDNYLQTSLTQERNRNDDLSALAAALKQENMKLSGQIIELRKSIDANHSSENTFQTRNTQLEKQVQELSLALKFADVDCNLSRVDAQQMISNARQRRDLLSEALATLNDLTRSKDVAVQEKARSKLNQLNKIASTLRD